MHAPDTGGVVFKVVLSVLEVTETKYIFSIFKKICII